MMSPPLAVVVIPTLNEAAHIGRVLAELASEPTGWPIYVIDGGSVDGTCDIVQTVAVGRGDITLLNNPQRTQAHAVNLAARIAAELGATYLIRVDAHAHYPKGFLRGIVQTLEQTPVDSVVVPLIAVSEGDSWQKAAGLLQQSWLGHGGAQHRRQRASGLVRHGHHAGFRLSAFLALGGYDTGFSANEDAEFDARLIAKGGKIFLQSRWPVGYLPRATIRKTWAQYQRNGYWRAQTLLRHGQVSIRQLAPPVFTATLLGVLVFGVAWPPAFLVWLCAGCGIGIASFMAAGAKLDTAARIAALATVMHFGSRLGFLSALILHLRATPHSQPKRVFQ